MSLLQRAIRKFAPSLLSDTYTQYFNTPVKFVNGDWHTNERIVEVAFALTQIGLDSPGKRVLEFGCTKSDLSLQLASFGYDVTGIDLRPYRFTHPNLSFHQGNVLAYEPQEGFDFITSISVIEHIGLGAYGEDESRADLEQIAGKLASLLVDGGKLIITVPFGQKYSDSFLRSFSREEIAMLFDVDNLNLAVERYFVRTKPKSWEPTTLEKAIAVSNERSMRGPTGVNCVGCFMWQKGNNLR